MPIPMLPLVVKVPFADVVALPPTQTLFAILRFVVEAPAESVASPDVVSAASELLPETVRVVAEKLPAIKLVAKKFVVVADVLVAFSAVKF